MEVTKHGILVANERDAAHFEAAYIAARQKEHRYYTNHEVLQLPEIDVMHAHYNEWQIRKKTCNRLTAYLADKKRPLHILEVGCGNGWLSAKLADIQHCTVLGTDINETELKQAIEVFGERSNLSFEYKDIREDVSAVRQFDIIVFAASIQYFGSLPEILKSANRLLPEHGEIHILDTIFYKKDQVPAAQQRTRTYYDSMGNSAMTGYYFHHTLDELKSFSHTILYNPRSILNRTVNRHDPFFWIRIDTHKVA